MELMEINSSGDYFNSKGSIQSNQAIKIPCSETFPKVRLIATKRCKIYFLFIQHTPWHRYTSFQRHESWHLSVPFQSFHVSVSTSIKVTFGCTTPAGARNILQSGMDWWFWPTNPTEAIWCIKFCLNHKLCLPQQKYILHCLNVHEDA